MTDVVTGIRDAIRDLLVPELKALQVEMKHVQETVASHSEDLKAIQREMNERFASMQREMNERFESIQYEMHNRFESLQREMTERFEAIQREMNERFASLQREMNERFESVIREMHQLHGAAMAQIHTDREETLRHFVKQGEALGRIEGKLSIMDFKMNYLDRVERVEEVLRRVTEKVGIEYQTT